MHEKPTQHLARLASALAQSRPELALEQALSVVRELGIVPAEPGQTPWLTLAHEGHTLPLAALAGIPPDADTISNFLQAGFARAREHDLRARVQERMELLSAASFEGLFFHVDGRLFDYNQRLTEIGGYERTDILGEQFMRRCIAPEDLPGVLKRVADGYEGEYVITAVRKDGSRFRAELQAKQGKLGERPVRVVAVRDVTERERAQELLRESELRLRNLLEQTFDLTAFVRDGVVVDLLGRPEGLLGYSREQVIGRGVLDFVVEREHAHVRRALAEQQPGPYETCARAQSGEEVPVEVVAVHATLQGVPVRMSAMRDLRQAKRLEAERRELESALERSQRLDSLGVLAGGIAHDFNNLLTVVLGHAELLQHRLGGAPERELASGIVDAAQRAAGLTAQMLAYAGRGELGPRAPVELGALVQDLRTLLDAGLSKKARISLALTPGCVVLGNRATLTQVIMNLLTNASDALQGEAGTIELRTCLIEQPDARWRRALGNRVTPGRWVLLEVRDSGVGMDPATQARIFEPFFSTKPTGHGLGLAACVGIVSSHGGAILVESQPGRGSTFSVLLPAHGGAPGESSQTPSPPAPGARRVLVVDDEPTVRSHLRIALSIHGYVVEEADNGACALALLARGEPSVVLLDMTMPDLSGLEVLRRLRASGSRVPVVLTSGYHEVPLELEAGSYQGFLVKPYRLEELFAKLESALGSR